MSNTINEVLLRPIITEKSSIQAKFGKYTFAIPDWANKNHVREAFAKFFPNHKVLKVNVAKNLGKTRRTAKGRKQAVDGKKAIITVDGDHIEYFPEI